MTCVGVLGLQGSIMEHITALSKLGDVKPLTVRTEEDLKKVSGLIIPGGESTTLRKLLKEFHMEEPILDRILTGMPVWGTCAGMVLLAKEVAGENQSLLGVMNVRVLRNAYGGQMDSFVTSSIIEAVSDEPFPMVFIRAPVIDRVGENVKILNVLNEKITACREKNIVVTSFHPELTERLDFHRYFTHMVKKQ